MASLNPIDGSPLGRKRAAHLLRRTTFGPTKQDIDTFANLNITQALDILLEPKEAPEPPNDPATGTTWIGTVNGDDEEQRKRYVTHWWADLMKNDGNSIMESMVWFYHTHFTTIISRVNESSAIYYQLALFRYYALGNFKEIAKKICYDNAMLYNLDGRLNIKGRVQENFAREFFELYTIGKGPQVSATDYTTFTEQDVKEGARVLSGFDVDSTFLGNIDEETGIPMGVVKGAPNASQHDDGVKVFSERFQGTTISTNGNTAEALMEELDEFVEMIFAQEATARYICRRLYRYFTYYLIPEEVENDIIAPLAQTFIDNDYELLPVLDQLLRSQHFFDEDNGITTDDNIGAIIKSPLDLTLGAMRFFNVEMPDKESDLARHYEAWDRVLYDMLPGQGLDFYEPYDVAGYDAYFQEPVFNRNWISPNNLMLRYQLGSALVDGVRGEDDNILFQVPMMTYVLNSGINTDSDTAILDYFIENMLPEEITEERYEYFRSVLLIDQEEWADVLSNDDFEIIILHIQELVKVLLNSPEYQLM